MAPGSHDLGIRCGRVLLWDEQSQDWVIEQDYYLGIQGNSIAQLAPWDQKLGNQAKRLIQAPHHLVMPGLINAHTHLPMTLLRGMAEDVPFHDWIYKTIIPLETKYVSPEFVFDGSLLAAAELIRSGTTTVCDMYYYEWSIARALDQAGMRGILAQSLADFPAPDCKDGSASPTLTELVDQLLAEFGKHERITPAYGPHAPYSLSDESFAKFMKRFERSPLPVTVHVSETEREVNEAVAQYGMRPVERLAKLGFLKTKPIVAHGVHLNDHEVELLVQAGGSVIYNPESNMKLGSGTARIPDYLKAGLKVGIGTDGSASNNDLSIFGEMDSGIKLQKLAHAGETSMTAHQTLTLATWRGAEALGLGNVTGKIKVGLRADLIFVNLDVPHLSPYHDLVAQLVYAAKGPEVDTVICDGKILMENRELKTLDWESIRNKAQTWANQLGAL